MVAKLASKMAAIRERWVMTPVFSRVAGNRCSKTMDSIVLSAVEIPSGSVTPGACQSRVGSSGGIDAGQRPANADGRVRSSGRRHTLARR